MNLKLIAPIMNSPIGFPINPTSYREATSACQTGKLLDVRDDTEWVLRMDRIFTRRVDRT